MPIPRNNILHDQYMDETRWFMRRFGYDPRLPGPLVHPIDVPQEGVIDPRDIVVTRLPRHLQNVMDPPINTRQLSPRNTQSPRRNTQSPRRNTQSPRRNTQSPRRNTRSPRRNNGGKTRKQKSRKYKNK